MHVSTRELLAQYTVLLNRFGTDSEEAEAFLQENRSNSEFVELAELSKTLKEALTAPTLHDQADEAGLRK